VLLRGTRVDRVVVDRDCVVAFSCRVENARPTVFGDEVPRTVDVAVGPSFRGAHNPYPPTHNPTFFFHSFQFTTRYADYAKSMQIVAVSAIILGAYQQNSLLFCHLSPDS